MKKNPKIVLFLSNVSITPTYKIFMLEMDSSFLVLNPRAKMSSKSSLSFPNKEKAVNFDSTKDRLLPPPYLPNLPDVRIRFRSLLVLSVSSEKRLGSPRRRSPLQYLTRWVVLVSVHRTGGSYIAS